MTAEDHSPPHPLIEFRNVTIVRGGHRLLDAVSLTIQE
ncbi:MAG TPA: molybdenum ABC transporter ATP-binding protein, partial [Methanoculleus sp.]|nr:molybdenum ABC transporter ATP-binding protein [Methanoculleus sp.]